jgi:hypothetical protein
MRTTVNLDDDVLRLVAEYAESRSLTLGRALSELVRKGLAAKQPMRIVNGVRVFDLPPNSPTVTSQKIRDLDSAIG